MSNKTVQTTFHDGNIQTFDRSTSSPISPRTQPDFPAYTTKSAEPNRAWVREPQPNGRLQSYEIKFSQPSASSQQQLKPSKSRHGDCWQFPGQRCKGSNELEEFNSMWRSHFNEDSDVFLERRNAVANMNFDRAIVGMAVFTVPSLTPSPCTSPQHPPPATARKPAQPKTLTMRVWYRCPHPLGAYGQRSCDCRLESYTLTYCRELDSWLANHSFQCSVMRCSGTRACRCLVCQFPGTFPMIKRGESFRFEATVMVMRPAWDVEPWYPDIEVPSPEAESILPPKPGPLPIVSVDWLLDGEPLSDTPCDEQLHAGVAKGWRWYRTATKSSFNISRSLNRLTSRNSSKRSPLKKRRARPQISSLAILRAYASMNKLLTAPTKATNGKRPSGELNKLPPPELWGAECGDKKNWRPVRGRAVGDDDTIQLLSIAFFNSEMKEQREGMLCWLRERRREINIEEDDDELDNWEGDVTDGLSVVEMYLQRVLLCMTVLAHASHEENAIVSLPSRSSMGVV